MSSSKFEISEERFSWLQAPRGCNRLTAPAPAEARLVFKSCMCSYRLILCVDTHCGEGGQQRRLIAHGPAESVGFLDHKRHKHDMQSDRQLLFIQLGPLSVLLIRLICQQLHYSELARMFTSSSPCSQLPRLWLHFRDTDMKRVPKHLRCERDALWSTHFSLCLNNTPVEKLLSVMMMIKHEQ